MILINLKNFNYKKRTEKETEIYITKTIHLHTAP